jgi:hypothetical protein
VIKPSAGGSAPPRSHPHVLQCNEAREREQR